MDWILLIAVIILLILWRDHARRLAEMERRIDDSNEIRLLTRRVWQLEKTVSELKQEPVEAVAEAPAAKREPEPRPVEVPPSPEPVFVAPQVNVDAPVWKVPPLTEPIEAIPERPHAVRGTDEWEAVVGGNWLNKLGIFVLVIAIALFLGYSFTQLGPAGRSSIGLAISVALLIAGVMLERRERYIIFGRGLISGGWAALYFTTYAMQALAAAKVIGNPLAGGFLLLATAAGMVVHSLRYRVQAVTGLAYAVAFGTLAITPVTALSVIALIPLAASLLVVAYRFSWSGMALFGLVATYATCASRGDSGAPLWSAQTVFFTYWLLFEAFDLLRTRRRSNHPAEQAILPLNALAFGALSYAKWSTAAPDRMYVLAAGMAAVYLVSMMVRTRLRPPRSFPPETPVLERIFAGGYEGSITWAAMLSAAAVALRLHGQTVNNLLLAEGELLFLAGLWFHQDYPRRLAAWVFGGLGLKLLLTDIPDAGIVQFAGSTLKDWTPSAALAALLFYTNRGLRSSVRSYGYAASAVVALIIGFETPLRYLGLAWLGLGTLLFTFGWLRRLFDFRVQAYFAGVLAVGAIGLQQARIAAGMAAPAHAWISLACATALAYAAALCALRSAPDRLQERERRLLQTSANWAAISAAAALAWRTVPAVYLGPVWMTLGLLALELDLLRLPPGFRRQAYGIEAVGTLGVLCYTVLPFHRLSLPDDRIAIGAAAIAAYAFAARMFAARRHIPAEEWRTATNLASAAGSLFLLIELWGLLDPVAVAPAWALVALGLVTVGLRADLSEVRLQGHLVAAAAFGRLLFANFDAIGATWGFSHRLLTVLLVVACHYYEWWRQRRVAERLGGSELSLRRPYLYAAAGLMAGLLYFELRPPFIEVGWAFLALALLLAGHFKDVPDFRFQSYVMATVAFGRALAVEFDFSQVVASAGERIAAGVLVIGCLFMAHLITPQPRQQGTGWEQRARLLYSLLSTTLATALLFREVSGSMLTVAWGIEGAVLLGAGFPLRDRTLRLSGLALFLFCTSKLFFYDLRQLETLYRILSFFVLGVILVSVSWLYTRFRDRVQRYL